MYRVSFRYTQITIPVPASYTVGTCIDKLKASRVSEMTHRYKIDDLHLPRDSKELVESKRTILRFNNRHFYLNTIIGGKSYCIISSGLVPAHGVEWDILGCPTLSQLIQFHCIGTNGLFWGVLLVGVILMSFAPGPSNG